MVLFQAKIHFEEKPFDPVSLSGIAENIDIISDKTEMQNIINKLFDFLQKEVRIVELIIIL